MRLRNHRGGTRLLQSQGGYNVLPAKREEESPCDFLLRGKKRKRKGLRGEKKEMATRPPARHLEGRSPVLGPTCGFDEKRGRQMSRCAHLRVPFAGGEKKVFGRPLGHFFVRGKEREQTLHATEKRAWISSVTGEKKRSAVRQKKKRGEIKLYLRIGNIIRRGRGKKGNNTGETVPGSQRRFLPSEKEMVHP